MDLTKVDISDAASFPGFLISNSIACYGLVLISVTCLVTLITYPLFWAAIWSLIFYIIPVLVSMVISEFIDGYLTEFVYEKYLIKRRNLAGLLDLFHFFFSIFEGFGAAFI
jgi:hypothetical protein